MQDIMNQLVDMEQEMIALKDENRKLKDRAKYYANWVQDLQQENYLEAECLEAEVQAYVQVKRQYGKYLPSEALGRLEYKIRDLYKYLEELREEHINYISKGTHR